MVKINHENAYTQNIKPVKSEKGCNIEELDETIELRLFMQITTYSGLASRILCSTS